jgi:hypothetical protein
MTKAENVLEKLAVSGEFIGKSVMNGFISRLKKVKELKGVAKSELINKTDKQYGNIYTKMTSDQHYAAEHYDKYNRPGHNSPIYMFNLTTKPDKYIRGWSTKPKSEQKQILNDV